MAALFASTSSPLLRRGHTLAGGDVPFITQLRKCWRSALTVWMCGITFGASSPVPKLLPGQFGGGSVPPARLALNIVFGVGTIKPP